MIILRGTVEQAAEESRRLAMRGMNFGCVEEHQKDSVVRGRSVDYIEQATVGHEPTACVLTYTRDDVEGFFKCWHLAVHRPGIEGFREIEENLVKKWCLLVFGREKFGRIRRVSLKGDPAGVSKDYHFVVEVKDWLSAEPLIVVPGAEGSSLPGKVQPM